MHSRLSLVVGAVLAMGHAYALSVVGPTTTLEIVNKQVSPDGFTRDAVTANGQVPGPLISATKGDQFNINVIDKLTDNSMDVATSIHWHGLFQHTTAWADGPAFVTQCPIIPGDSFDYCFRAPGQAGTYWWHSHLSTQYCDGLSGPLVIYDPFDPNKYLYDIDDASTVIALTDWYHSHVAVGTFPNPDATLFNGLGRYQGGPATDLSVTTVTKGLRYRLRLVALACHAQWTFSIDNHNFTVIEADGISTAPLTVDSIVIMPAQRYSVVLHANQPVGNYWIRALPNLFNGNISTDNGINSAILRYVGAPTNEPTTSQTTSVAPFNEVNLHTLVNPGAPGQPFPGGADVQIQLNMTFGANGAPVFEVNGVTYASPPLPVLLQILNGSQTAQSLLPSGSVYTLPRNKVIEVVFNPGVLAGAPHPFHLHGHVFDVVRSAGSTTYNYVNPIRRDTVNVGGQTGGDLTTIRFTTNNPGPWFLHCHIDVHLVTGLAIVFAEAPADVAATNPVPNSWKELCPTYLPWQANHTAQDPPPTKRSVYDWPMP